MLKNQTLRLIHSVTCLLLVTALCGQTAWAQSQTASTLFKQLQAGVFQIRTIDLASGDKSSIGSGFAISNGAYIATNFHVISLKVHSPDTFRVEVVDKSGKRIDATIVAIDLVHDLALLSTEQPQQSFFPLRDSVPSQGERIFSLGNPQDLGKTIIEGNYNGLIQKSRYQKILFSGSLNAGMSGGPAIDSNGLVLGVNVAKAGEQISFLVPAKHLKNLLAKASDTSEDAAVDFSRQIRDDLYADQSGYYSPLIEADWQLESFGDLMLPHNISNSLRCWGHTIEDDEVRYDSFHQHCRSDDAIYISNEFYTGQFEFDFEWLSTEQLNSFQFYQALEGHFDHNLPTNVRDDSAASAYQCLTDIVEIASGRWKVSTCFRAYQDYEDLFDTSLVMASLDKDKQGAVIKLSASGISRNIASSLFGKLMGSIQWKP